VEGRWWLDWFLVVGVLECFAELAHTCEYARVRIRDGLPAFLICCAPPPLLIPTEDILHSLWPKGMTSFVVRPILLPSLSTLTIINHVRPKTQSVHYIWLIAQANKLELYEFFASCWANVPKLAISETGFKEGDIEFESVVLAEVSLSDPLDTLRRTSD
jgi:hypothetical protein